MKNYKIKAMAFGSVLKLSAIGLGVVLAPFFLLMGIGAFFAWEGVSVRGWSGRLEGWAGLLQSGLLYSAFVAIFSFGWSLVLWVGVRLFLLFGTLSLRADLSEE